jgi:hypothetical protein
MAKSIKVSMANPTTQSEPTVDAFKRSANIILVLNIWLDFEWGWSLVPRVDDGEMTEATKGSALGPSYRFILISLKSSNIPHDDATMISRESWI